MTELEVSRRERKKEETRQRIFKAAVKLFRERGFEATTVDEIAERADVAKGTFFNHFPRKEAVLNYLSEQRLELVEESAAARLAEARPAREKLIDLYVSAAKAYEEDRELSRFVLAEMFKLSFEPAQDAGKRWDQLIVQLVEQGQKNGELRGDLVVPRAINVLTSVYYGLLYMWAHCLDLPADLEPELRAQLALVMDGLAVRPEGSRA